MPKIKVSALNYLLYQSQKSANREKLRQFIAPDSNYTLDPKWMGVAIALLLQDFAALKHQLAKLGFHVDNLKNGDFYAAVHLFLDPQQLPKDCDFSQGMRIPNKLICHYMAKVDVVFNIAKSGNIALLEEIINNKLVIPHTLINAYGESLLHALAQGGHYQAVKKFQVEYPLLKKYDMNYATPLHHLIAHTRLDSLDRVTPTKNFNLMEGKDKHGAAYMHYFAMGVSWAELEYAKSEGRLEIDTRDNHGNTVLNYMALGGADEAELTSAERLSLITGSITNHYGDSLLHSRASSGRLDELNQDDTPWLLPNAQEETLLHKVARSGNYAELRSVVLAQCNTVCDNEGNTPWHTSVDSWNDGLSLDAYCDTSAQNNQGFTPKELWVQEVNNYYDGKPTHSSFFTFYATILSHCKADLAESCRLNGTVLDNAALEIPRQAFIEALYNSPIETLRFNQQALDMLAETLSLLVFDDMPSLVDEPALSSSYWQRLPMEIQLRCYKLIPFDSLLHLLIQIARSNSSSFYTKDNHKAITTYLQLRPEQLIAFLQLPETTADMIVTLGKNFPELAMTTIGQPKLRAKLSRNHVMEILHSQPKVAAHLIANKELFRSYANDLCLVLSTIHKNDSSKMEEIVDYFLTGKQITRDNVIDWFFPIDQILTDKVVDFFRDNSLDFLVNIAAYYVDLLLAAKIAVLIHRITPNDVLRHFHPSLQTNAIFLELIEERLAFEEKAPTSAKRLGDFYKMFHPAIECDTTPNLGKASQQRNYFSRTT